MKETWKDIKGYQGHYQVSNLGNIRSIKFDIKIIKQTKNTKGYLYVGLSKNGKVKRCSVHRLVAQIWIKNIKKRETVNHKDCNKTNNCISNLEWNSYSENELHSYRNGKISTKGEKIWISKLNESLIRKIRALNDLTQKQIANKFKVDQSLISRILSNKIWKHV